MDAKLKAAQEELTNQVMDWPGVSGTAIGERQGAPCLLVYLSDPSVKKRIPGRVAGFPVFADMTGSFKRL